ncbi:CNNM domain-containing protein, partial [uncultured Muribaculum sp.]|uniref:CNNM domain-containing protein n=1 Tax=uncultured Muribaculum sp. TaxID=1918613 RepID=UPI0025B6FF19
METWIIITLVSLLLSALFSGCEMAYVTSDRVRVELDSKRSGPIAAILRLFYSNSELFISTILVGNNVVLVIYGMGAAQLLEGTLRQWLPGEALVLLAQTLISTGVILLTGEFFPKTIFGINPNNSLKVFALPLYILYIVLYP